MKQYQRKIVERPVQEMVGAFCDWCGISDDDAYAEIGYPLTEVVLSINEGEEFGARWTKDICGQCAAKVFNGFRSLGYMGGLLGDNEEKVSGDTPIPEPYIKPDRDEEDEDE